MEEPNLLSCQTLCILANIADGNTAKDLIVSNDDMLQKVKYYMVHDMPQQCFDKVLLDVT